MKDLNCVHLIGRLGQDPEVYYSDRGAVRTTFSVTTSRIWRDVGGQVQTETEWTRCITWGTLAETAAQYLSKGSRVFVAGRLRTSHWEDAQTGEWWSSVELVVDDLILLDRPTPAGTTEDAGDAGETQPSSAASVQLIGKWRLQSDGPVDVPVSVPEDLHVSLWFGPEHLQAQACNSLEGEYTAHGQTIEVGPLILTAMACDAK